MRRENEGRGRYERNRRSSGGQWRHGLVKTVSGGGELDGELGVEGERTNRGVKVSLQENQELPYSEF